MPKPYSEELRAEAVSLYATLGPSEAARRVGCSKAAVVKWAKAKGVAVAGLTQATEESHARLLLSAAEWREEMVSMLRQISSASAEVELQLLSRRGALVPELGKATAARVKSINDLMLLTGEATSRVGHQGDRAEQATGIARLRDELAERRRVSA